LLLGGLAVKFALGEARLGQLSFTMYLGFGVLGLLSALWVRHISWRAIAALATAVMILALLAITKISGFTGLNAAIMIAGAGAGALYALAMVIFGYSSTPAKAYGFKLGMETLPGAIMLLVIPVMVTPYWGFPGLIIAVAIAIFCMSIIPLPWIPHVRDVTLRTLEAELHHTDPAQAPAGTLMAFWLSFFSSLLFLTGVTAIWAFLELIGSKTGATSYEMGVIFSVGLLINTAGGFIASGVHFKFGRIVPVLAIVVLEIISLVLLGQFESVTVFAIGVTIFQFSINFVLAYTFGLMAEFDPSGSLASFGAICLAAGGAFGPLTSGALIENWGYGAALEFSGLCSAIALAVYVFTTLRWRRPGPLPE